MYIHLNAMNTRLSLQRDFSKSKEISVILTLKGVLIEDNASVKV